MIVGFSRRFLVTIVFVVFVTAIAAVFWWRPANVGPVQRGACGKIANSEKHSKVRRYRCLPGESVFPMDGVLDEPQHDAASWRMPAIPQVGHCVGQVDAIRNKSRTSRVLLQEHQRSTAPPLAVSRWVQRSALIETGMEQKRTC